MLESVFEPLAQSQTVHAIRAKQLVRYPLLLDAIFLFPLQSDTVDVNLLLKYATDWQ
jgi:hypothetical protein